LTTTAGCVLSSAQLNTLEKVSAVRSQRPVQAERSVFAGLPGTDDDDDDDDDDINLRPRDLPKGIRTC
jgi:hypothetical protein